MQTVSIAGTELSDFRFDHDDDLSELGGAASRFICNVAAIALLKRPEAKSHPPSELGRDVTDEDRCASPQSKTEAVHKGVSGDGPIRLCAVCQLASGEGF